jgi:chromosome segregation ATPase
LNEKNEPKLKDIGNNEELKKKYIRLAVFLLQYPIEKDRNYSGISSHLMQHLQRIVELRHKIVICLTRWIEYLTRDIFSYVFGLEGVSVNEEFLRNLKINYYDEELITRIRTEYETKIRTRDEEINDLRLQLTKRDELIELIRNENTQLRNGNSRYEYEVKRLETIIAEYETQITNLKIQNNTYITQINQFMTTITNLNLKLEENEELAHSAGEQSTEFLNIISGLEKKLNDFEIDYRNLQNENTLLQTKITNYVTQITNYNTTITNFNTTIKEKETHILNSQDQSKKYLETIRLLEERINNYENETSRYKNEISELQKKIIIYNTQITQINIENEKKLIELTGQIEKVKTEYSTIIRSYEEKVTILIREKSVVEKEREGLIISFNEVRNLPPQIQYVERERLLSQIVEVNILQINLN